MLRLLGSPKRCCDGLTRRDWLEVGGLGLLGLGASDLLRATSLANEPTPSHSSFGKAKSCILLYLYGAPSQLETFDPKPEAPAEIRGELGTIQSVLPGIRVGELLPKVARVLDRATVIRSMSHPYPVHGVAFATTSVPSIDIPMELQPRDGRHWPYIGSVVDYADEKANIASTGIPRNLALPWPFSSRRRGEVPRAGPYPAFLGQGHAPIWTQFHGEGTVPFPKSLLAETVHFRDPYMGIGPDARFEISGGSAAGPASADERLVLDRLHRRRSLLEQFDDSRRRIDQESATIGYSRLQQLAIEMVTSPRLRQALDVSKEPIAVRERYGMTLFGQSALAARRLVEAQGRFISVFWDEFGLAGSGWDTHGNHFPRMREELCPPFDQAFAALVTDLEDRGLLDSTLVAVLSEHGRTPKLTTGNGGGRDHWSRAYSVVLAGGGIARGRVIGRTDRIAGDVVENVVSPKDVLATMLHALGIDPEMVVRDRLGRPLRLAGEGRVREELFA